MSWAMSAFGPKPTYRLARLTSAFGGVEPTAPITLQSRL